MERRRFGDTGLWVPALGLGTGAIGRADLDEGDVARLLSRALELGVTFFDSARSYGVAEARLGRHLASRRSELVIATKVGYGIPGLADWTGPCITAGVEAALELCRTDHLDVVLLHSCPKEILDRGEVPAALDAAVRAGKVRAAGYSGEGEALDAAIEGAWCRVIETSVNLFDQRGLDGAIARARDRGLGVIAKRPLGNAPWRFDARPVGDYAETYWLRMKAMALDARGLDLDELALRFAAWAPGVDVAIAGTASLAHLERLAAIARRGPLDPSHVEALRAEFRANDDGWVGQI